MPLVACMALEIDVKMDKGRNSQPAPEAMHKIPYGVYPQAARHTFVTSFAVMGQMHLLEWLTA